MKNFSFTFVTSSTSSIIEYLACRPLRVTFQVLRLTRVCQARLSEKRIKDKLIKAYKYKGKV